MVKQCPTTTHLWGKEKEPKKRTTVGNADISCGSDGSREGRQFCFRKVWESVPRKAETLRPRTIHVAWTLRPRTIEGKECRCVCVCWVGSCMVCVCKGWGVHVQVWDHNTGRTGSRAHVQGREMLKSALEEKDLRREVGLGGQGRDTEINDNNGLTKWGAECICTM